MTNNLGAKAKQHAPKYKSDREPPQRQIPDTFRNSNPGREASEARSYRPNDPRNRTDQPVNHIRVNCEESRGTGGAGARVYHGGNRAGNGAGRGEKPPEGPSAAAGQRRRGGRRRAEPGRDLHRQAIALRFGGGEKFLDSVGSGGEEEEEELLGLFVGFPKPHAPASGSSP
jgi:hypothetical protein